MLSGPREDTPLMDASYRVSESVCRHCAILVADVAARSVVLFPHGKDTSRTCESRLALDRRKRNSRHRSGGAGILFAVGQWRHLDGCVSRGLFAGGHRVDRGGAVVGDAPIRTCRAEGH